MTEACARHAEDHIRLVSWVALQAQFAETIDKVRETARKALAATRDESEDPSPPSEFTAAQALRRFRRLNVEVTLCRAVDNYLAYLSDLLALVFKLRPETLRSAETVRLDYVLQYSSMDALIEALAERRVERLSYTGLPDLETYLDERVGFALFSSTGDREKVVRLVEARNLLVHKRGMVDERYVRKSGDPEARAGERVSLDRWAVDGVTDGLPAVVGDTDRRAASKWDLPRPRTLDSVFSGGNGEVTDEAETSRSGPESETAKTAQ